MKKTLLGSMIALFACIEVNAAEYLVPYDYDNVLASVKSQGYDVITQSSTLSTTQWNIGGTNHNYRCLTIPKISCSSGTTVKLYANVSELILTRPDAVVANQKPLLPFIYDIRYETSGTNWKLCGAAIGGEMYDNVTYSNGQITYSPNYYSNMYTYFTEVAITNSTAYMALTYNQVCQ